MGEENMGRIIEERTIYSFTASGGVDLANEWGPAHEDTLSAFRRAYNGSDASATKFVRAWNAAAKARGDNTRIRSREEEEES
jgi:hypothetical protein